MTSFAASKYADDDDEDDEACLRALEEVEAKILQPRQAQLISPIYTPSSGGEQSAVTCHCRSNLKKRLPAGAQEGGKRPWAAQVGRVGFGGKDGHRMFELPPVQRPC